jgi:sugar-specific transcriptional regulator TrmB
MTVVIKKKDEKNEELIKNKDELIKNRDELIKNRDELIKNRDEEIKKNVEVMKNIYEVIENFRKEIENLLKNNTQSNLSSSSSTPCKNIINNSKGSFCILSDFIYYFITYLFNDI